MFKDILWDVVGKFGIQIVSFVISVVLTRLLSPLEYGIMGMAMVVITVAHVFLEAGFSRAIIQQSEISSLQYSTVFYLNTAVALVLTLACYLSAGPLATFYEQPLVAPVFRAVSFSFLINGLNLVPSSILYKRLHFKANSIQSIISAVVSGVIGIWMAYNGYGVWSLVTQSLLGSSMLLVMNFLYTRWWPRLEFSLPAIQPLWKYGSRMFASGLLDTMYTRLDGFIIGKVFNPVMLGYYNRAQSMDSVVRSFSSSAIMGAMFPHIARHQNDRDYLRSLYLKYLHIILFVSVGLSGVLALLATDLFTLLFTAKWTYSAGLFQLMCLGGFIWPASSLMVNIIFGVGNSSAFLRLEVIKKIIVLPVYLFGFLLGLKYFIVFMVLTGFLSVGVNAVYTGREIGLTLGPQLRIILAYLMTALASFVFAYGVGGLLPDTHVAIRMFVYGITFAAPYLCCAYVARLEGFAALGSVVGRIKTFLK